MPNHLIFKYRRKLSMRKANWSKNMSLRDLLNGLNSKISFWNVEQQYKTLQRFRPLTQTTFKCSNLVHKPFLFRWKRHPLDQFRIKISIFFRLFYIISIQTMYVNQNLRIPSHFGKLRATSKMQDAMMQQWWEGQFGQGCHQNALIN